MMFTVLIVSVEQNEEFRESSPLHSSWDKITVKNRRGGVPEPLEPSPGYAPDP